jgi:eukaryotic-like serine/threonine-protein kinase
MSLAKGLEEEEEDTVALPSSRSAPQLGSADDPPRSGRFPGRVEPGTMLGNYVVMTCLARGGMASVWVARHRSARGLSKIVTLKTILPELAAEPSFEHMFLQEARLASLIHHPNVCETFELIEIDGVLALSMEWVDGASLARMLNASDEPLDARIAARIAAQAAAGLHAAHELRDEAGRPMNLVHRDVSPQNILLSRDGHVRLSDFGIAKAMSGMRELSSVVHVQGKAAYLSPEQARNEPLDRRSDIFSLGTVLYLAALGRRPFARPDDRIEQGLARLLRGDFLHPLSLNPAFPPELGEIIVRAMQSDPAQRYQTAADMRQDLELWLARSGPFIAEQAVARSLDQRCGPAIERQQALIRAAMSCDDEQPLSARGAPHSVHPIEVHESGTFRSATHLDAPEPPSEARTQPETTPSAAPTSPLDRPIPEPPRRPWPRAALALGCVLGIGAGVSSLTLGTAPTTRSATSRPAAQSAPTHRLLTPLPAPSPVVEAAERSSERTSPATAAQSPATEASADSRRRIIAVEALPTAARDPAKLGSAGPPKAGGANKELGPVERDL